MTFAFPGLSVQNGHLGPNEKKKMQTVISETLEQNGVSEHVIDQVLKAIDKASDEMSSQAINISSQRQLPYRIGIFFETQETDTSRPGLSVKTVFDDSPAAKAGIKAGDQIVKIDDHTVESHEDMVEAVQKAGEQNRAVRLEVMRDGVSTLYEIKPNQAAVAELNIDLGQSGMAFPSTVWGTQPWPKKGSNGFQNDPRFQEQMRDAMNSIMEASKNAMERNRKLPLSNSQKSNGVPENPFEKNLDEMREELSDIHADLNEIKEMLKKLSDKP